MSGNTTESGNAGDNISSTGNTSENSGSTGNGSGSSSGGGPSSGGGTSGGGSSSGRVADTSKPVTVSGNGAEDKNSTVTTNPDGSTTTIMTNTDGSTVKVETITKKSKDGAVTQKIKYDTVTANGKETVASFDVNSKGRVTLSKIKTDETYVEIPESVMTADGEKPVTVIAKNAFKGNEKLKEVTIGKNVIEIKPGAF